MGEKLIREFSEKAVQLATVIDPGDRVRMLLCEVKTLDLYMREENARALAVYEAAGYRRDGSVRESDFRGVPLREPPLVKLL